MILRFKVKTAAIVMSVIVILGAAGYFLLPGILLDLKRYNTLERLYPHYPWSADALYWAAQDLDPGLDGYSTMIYVTGDSSMGASSAANSESAARAVSYLERLLVVDPNYKFVKRVQHTLALYYWNTNRLDESVKYFRMLESSTDSQDGYARDADSALKALASRNPQPDKKPLLTGVITIGGKPAENVIVLLRRADDNTYPSQPLGYNPLAVTDREGRYRFDEVEAAEYKLGVGLSAERLDGYVLTRANSREKLTITPGRTETEAVSFVPQVRIIEPVNKAQIEGDKLRLRWKPYPGADYYEVGITAIEFDANGKEVGTSSSTAPGKWREAEAEYSLDELHQSARFSGRSYSGNEFTLSVQGVLGMVYPGGQFVWSVSAYDKQGKLISNSAGYYTGTAGPVPFFSLPDKGQLKGDRLVLAGDYKGAVTAYERELPNPFAIRALARLWLDGFRDKDDEGDAAKALSYYRMLPNPSLVDLEQMENAEKKLASAKP